ncbi:response regulator [Spirochaeta isovalerica]|uniref:Two-component system chemotaxis response regulator CheY n=1 Tax=Spirochaeta isovalerica TaxID=150 RepID=A0A841R6J8_9SPIO|nr:two-component system chemotaxis response regulator CheY [Spirochaeta isovalerica]
MAKKILVVDDSAAIRQSVTFVLQQEGYETIEAADGAEGLEKIKGSAVDMVVSDVNMPNMDGITMVSKIRELSEFRFIPIIILTTESQSSKMEEGKAAGATGWIVKPFTSDKLLAVVKKLLG